MTIQKDCADHLRAHYRNLTGGKLGSGHAHELAAAFFGYSSAAALRAEVNYPLSNLVRAEILIPDLARMDQRIEQLQGLPGDLPGTDDLANVLCAYLEAQGQFGGDVWQTRDIAEYIDADFIQKDTMMIEDSLSSEIAVTNAYFDELYVEDMMLDDGLDALVAIATGSLNGENDPDRAYYGDKINFETVMTFNRVAGRTAYEMPILETGGALDMSLYDETA